MRIFYTYVLLSEKDGSFYVGYTSDLEDRLERHYKGQSKATAHRLPLKLVYYEACLNPEDAKSREKYFKTGFGRRFLKNRLQNFLNECR